MSRIKARKARIGRSLIIDERVRIDFVSLDRGNIRVKVHGAEEKVSLVKTPSEPHNSKGDVKTK